MNQPALIFGSNGYWSINSGVGDFALAIRTDNNGRLEVVTAAGAPLNVNVLQYGSQPVASAGLNGAFAVGGTVAPDVVYNSNPVGVGALANTDAAMPADVTAGRCVRIAADLKGRVHTNLGTIRGTAAVQGGVNGLLGVGGSEGDDVAAAANPVVVGGIYLNPQTALTASGRSGRLLLDQYRRLRITGAIEHRTPWPATEPSPVPGGGYADVTYTAAPAADGDICRFVTNARGWQRTEVYGPTLDAAVPAVAANYPVPVSGLYTAAPTAVLVDGAQGTILLDARRAQRVVGGDNADDAASAATWPILVGAVAEVDPTASSVADGDVARLQTDLERFLRTVSRAFDSGVQADRVEETAPLNLVVQPQTLIDTTNLAVNTYYYPSSDGVPVLGYKDFALTAQLISGVDNTVTLTVEGSNDPDVNPVTRIWHTVQGWRSDGTGWVTSLASAASTITTGFDHDNYNYVYYRVKIVVTNAGVLSNTVSVWLRRKAH